MLCVSFLCSFAMAARLTLLLTLFSSALAADSQRVIVSLHASVNRTDHLSATAASARAVVRTVNHVFTGYIADISPSAIAALRADSSVLAVEVDARGHADAQTAAAAVSRGPPAPVGNSTPKAPCAGHARGHADVAGGLQRISQRARLPSTAVEKSGLAFKYRSIPVGSNPVDLYHIDSGVNVHHDVFQGRAKLGPAFGFNSASVGLATHLMLQARRTTQAMGRTPPARRSGRSSAWRSTSSSSRAASKRDPLTAQAQGARSSHWLLDLEHDRRVRRLHPRRSLVRFDYVASQRKKTKRTSIITMSAGLYNATLTSDVLDAAVQGAVDAGVHVVLSAGNMNTDACKRAPPARRPI